jgi:phosphonate dehydrogenase
MEDWAREDLPRQIPAELLEHPRTLFTPHLGSAIEKVRLEIELEAARNAMQELEDEVPEGAVNCPSRDANHTSETDSRRERSM